MSKKRNQHTEEFKREAPRLQFGRRSPLRSLCPRSHGVQLEGSHSEREQQSGVQEFADVATAACTCSICYSTISARDVEARHPRANAAQPNLSAGVCLRIAHHIPEDQQC